MTTIKLIDGYFVEVDAMNYTLKKTYTITNKEGVEKECTKTIGYYPKFAHTIEKVIVLLQLEKTDDLTLELREYVKMVEESNKTSVQALKTVLDVYERN